MPRRERSFGWELLYGDRTAWGTVVVLLPVWIGAPALLPVLHWRRRLGWRGQFRVVAAQTALGTLVSHLLWPRLRAAVRASEASREDVRGAFFLAHGRAPTREELSGAVSARARERFERSHGASRN